MVEEFFLTLYNLFSTLLSKLVLITNME